MIANEGFPIAQKSQYEHALDPSTGLVLVLQEFGFEGLNDNQRLNLIEQASVDDYIIASDIIHRKVAPDENPNFHPEPVKIENPKTKEVTHVTADPSKRIDILTHALSNAQKLVKEYREKGGDTKDVLQRCGNLAAFGILLAQAGKKVMAARQGSYVNLFKMGMTVPIMNKSMNYNYLAQTDQMKEKDLELTLMLQKEYGQIKPIQILSHS